jgi:predicted lipoprotein
MPELVTWYTTIPIAKRDDGRHACDYTQAIECQSAQEAAQIAAAFARKPGYSAAVVFADRRSAYAAI